MGGARKTNRYNSGQGNQRQLADTLDQLAEFESFKELLPKIRQFVKDGKTAAEMYTYCQSYVAAKGISIALTSKDEKTALSAIKEILDRGVGKAADKVEITQRYEQLSDDELEALYRSQEQELEEDDKQAH